MKNVVITIGRQFGSGGRYVGRLLAEKLGVSTQMISNLELGKKAIRPDNLAKVCKALGLSADFVLYGADTQTTVDMIADKLTQLTEAELQIVNDMIDALNKNRA